MKMSLLPEPQHLETGEGRFSFPCETVQVCLEGIESHDSQNLLPALAEIGLKTAIVSGPADASLVLRNDQALVLPDQVRHDVIDQAYRIEINTGQISVTARGASGLFYGIQTLGQMLRQSSELPVACIVDWPDLPVRGLHMTCCGLSPTYEVMKQIIATLAGCKMNCLVLQYDDRFPFEKHPAIPVRSAFTKDQLRELVEFAKSHYLKINPLLDSLGHAGRYLKHEEYRHLAEKPGNTFLMCPSNPATLEFMKDLWSEVLEVHGDCDFAHITGDEVFRVDRYCSRCSPYTNDGRFSELYCRYYLQLSDWILERSCRPVVWSDMLVRYPESTSMLPKELVIHDWNYWNVTGIRDQRWKYGMCFGVGPITHESMDDLPPEVVARYRDYWLHESTRPDFTPFPYVRYFKDQGFDVIGGPVSSCEAGIFPIPPFPDTIYNNQYFAAALKGAGGLGIVTTHWGSNRTVPGSMHAVLSAANHGWHFTDQPLESFLDVLGKLYMPGTEKGVLNGLAQRLDSVNVPARGYLNGRTDLSAGIDAEARKQVALLRSHDPVMNIYCRTIEKNMDLSGFVAELYRACDEIDRMYMGVGDDICFDFRNVMNRRLTNCLHLPGRVLEEMGSGRKVSWGIPFDLVDPAGNNGNSVMSLYGKEVPDRPKRVCIPVNAGVDRLFFLHVSMYAPVDSKVAEHRLRLDDGSVSSMDVVVGHNVADWYSGKFPLAGNGLKAWSDCMYGEGGNEIKAYVAWWDNPCPGVPVQELEVVAGTGEQPGYYTLIGLTGRRGLRIEPETARMAELKRFLSGAISEFAEHENAFRKFYESFLPPDKAESAYLMRMSVKDVVETYLAKLDVLIAE